MEVVEHHMKDVVEVRKDMMEVHMESNQNHLRFGTMDFYFFSLRTEIVLIMKIWD